VPKLSARATKIKGNGRKSSKRPFLQLYRNVKRSAAYHGLSVYARAALTEILDRYNGCNNGMIGLGVRECAYELRCSKNAATRALRELDDAKLAHPTYVGAWRGKRASEWRLTFYRCDKTGELPTTQWERHTPFSEDPRKDAKEPQEGHRESPRTPGRTQGVKNPMNGSNPRSPGRTHINIYQGQGETPRGDGDELTNSENAAIGELVVCE
jgi:hypothetical protein